MRGLSFLVVLVVAGSAMLGFGGLTLLAFAIGLPMLLQGDPRSLMLALAGAFVVYAIGKFIGSTHSVLFGEHADAEAGELVPDSSVSVARALPAEPLPNELKRLRDPYAKRHH